MATTQKIEIPISLSAQIENLKDIRQTLIATLNSAGKDSSLAKTLTKDLTKINQMLGQVEDFALSPTIDESGLKQLQKVLDNFYKQAQSSFSNADFANFEAIASESDIARLKTLTAEAAKYRRELEALQKSGSSERTDAYLLRTGKQDLLGRAQAQKGFDSTASLGKNALAMERAAESYQRSADTMQSAIDKLESEANAAMANAQQAAQQVKTLEQQSKVLTADTQAAKFHHAAGRFKTAIVANRGVENPTIGSVERGLRSALESVQANGKIATDARNAVGDWIKHLFPQLPTSDIANMVGQDINTLLSDLMERIFGSGYLDTDVVYSPAHSAILSRAQDYSRSEINRIAGVHSTANVLDLTARNQQISSDLRKAKSRWTTYNNEADSKVTSWLEMTDQQEELTAAAQASAQLSQELYTLADAAQKAAIASKEAQIQQNAEAQQDLKEGATRPTHQLARQGKIASKQYQTADESFIGELNENLRGAKIDANEAEQFTNNLKQSITHWMSAQQIVNLVKDGIRQAYQDIKSLDAAMTNIAVVTDMSVSDLWGKINEYMSIAQQYGVTTQGVYEVSQLYYQQGLSTNEVMAATTETLKMARIAGMDYAEAADAMTVAIRSFKMEMSDAGHVTDVYSKVAAVTASDTEELAIAMSKTASSAESVGSSFENTTAMLAVMIETTRESAQNLGSALKSIISRYGEMKSGMTQDSEGEIIDYNKTDAALRSVGISLKDAQGQFRDFDDVIFELSAKWDSLDKNTQRYIATIMAGNRQQSRFIALVDNWERLDEVSQSAADSSDAGLLQYAKTLDSLETKLNQLSNNFQSFYMSIFNGEFFKGAVDIVNNLITSFSRLGPVLGSINLLQLINQIKLVGQLLINSFSKSITKIQSANKEWQNAFTGGWTSVGERIATAIANAIIAKAAPTGKQFAEGVVQGAQGGQVQPQNAVPWKNQGQTVQIKSKYQEQAQNYLKQIGLNFSVGNLFDQNGKLTKNASKEFLSPKKNSNVSSFENLTQSYQKQADAILKASDQFDKAAVNWANKVKAAGNGFEAKMGAAGKKAYLMALQAADAEAEIELAAARQAAAEQQKAATKQKLGQGLVMTGTALSSAGMMIDQSTMAGYDKSTWLQTGGAAASVLGQALMGNYIGAAITAISGAVTTITRWQERDKVELENAKKDAEEKNIERATKKEEYTSLSDYLTQLKELEETQYDSAEAAEKWIALNAEVQEKFSELGTTFDLAGNIIINLESAERKLISARQEAAKAARDAANAQIITAQKTRENAEKEKEEFNRTQTTKIRWNSVTQSTQGSKWDTIAGTAGGFIGDGLLTDEIISQLNIPAEGINGTVSELLTSDAPIIARKAYGKYYLETQNRIVSELAKYVKTTDTEVLNWLVSLSQFSDPAAAYQYFLQTYNSDYLIDSAQESAVIKDITQNKYSSFSELNEAVGRMATVVEDSVYDLDTTIKSGISLYLDASLMGLKEESYLLLNNTKTIFSNLLYKDYKTSGLSWEDWTTSSNGYTEAFAELSSLYTNFYNDLFSSQIISINDLISSLSAGNIDLEYFETQFKNILDNTLTENDSKVLAYYLNSFSETDNQKRVQYVKSLFGSAVTLKDGYFDSEHNWKEASLNSYNEWLTDTGKEDNLENQKSYRERLQNAITELDTFDEFFLNFIAKGPLALVEDFVGIKTAFDKLDESSAGYITAQKRLAEIKRLYSQEALGTEGIFGAVFNNTTAMSEFWSLLKTDTGTHDWASKLTNWETKYGVNVAEFEELAYENYNTRLQTVITSASAINTTLSDLSSNQEKGFGWEETQKLLKQVQNVDPAATWKTLFTYNEQGIITLIDFVKTADMLYQSSIKDLATEQSRSDTILTNIKEKKYDFSKLEEISSEELLYQGLLKDVKITEADAKTYAKNISQALGIEDESQIDSLTSAIASGLIYSHDSLLQYYQNWNNQIVDANNVFSKQSQALLAKNAFADWSQNFTKATNIKTLATVTSGTYSDFQQLWINRLEEDATNVFKNLENFEVPTFEETDTVIRNGVETSLKEAGLQVGDVKKITDWHTEDYKAYYNAQAEVLKQHGASFNAFGELIITDYDAYGKYIASLQYKEGSPEYNAIIAQTKAAQISAQETAVENLQGGIEGLYASFIEDGEIEFSEVENILTTLQPKITDDKYTELLQLYEKAKSGTAENFKTFIDELANLARAAGYNINEDEITAKIQDAYTSLVKTLFDSLSNAINGSLTADDLGSLETSLGLDLSAYQQQTLDGYQLSSEGLLKVAGELEHRYGNVAGYAEKMAELFVGEDKLYSGREELEARIAEIEKARDSEEKVSEELEYQLSLLKKMAATSRLNKDDPLFNFMNQDSTKGFAAGADEMVASIDKVKSAFSSIAAGEQILADDFYNMMDFMYNNRADKTIADKEWISIALGITEAQLGKFKTESIEIINTYEDFVNAIVSGSKELGKVDSKVLLDMGISMDTMSSSMSASLKEVAQDQINFLKNLRKTLEAYKALEDIGTIEMGSLTIGGESVSINLDNFKDYLSTPEFAKEAENFEKTLLKELASRFGEGVSEQAITDALFGGDFTFNEDSEVLIKLRNFFNTIETFTSQEWQAFILSYPQLFTESGWDLKALSEVISSELDFSDLLSGISSEAAANINAAIQGKTIANIELGLNNLTYTFTGEGDGDWKAAKQALQTLYQGQGVTAEFTLEGETVTVHYVNADVKATVDSLKKANFSGLSIDYDSKLKQYLGTFTLEGQTINVSVDPSGIKFTGPDGSKIDETMQSAIEAQFTGIGAYDVTSELDENGVFNVTVSDASVNALATINTNVASIVDLLSTGITVSVDSEAANEALAAIQEAYIALKESITNNPIKVPFDDGPLPTAAISDNKDTDVNVTVDAATAQTSLDEIITKLSIINRGANSMINVNITEDGKTELKDFSDTVLSLNNTFEAVIKAVEAEDNETAKASLDEIITKLSIINRGANSTIAVGIAEDEQTELENFSSTVLSLDDTFEAVIKAIGTGDKEAVQTSLDAIIAKLNTINSGANSTITANITEDGETELEDFSDTVLKLDDTFEATIKAVETGAAEVAKAIDAAAADREATIYVKYEDGKGSSVHESSTGTEHGGGTGRGFAKGSAVNMLQHGAALAQGTLMGELGPELYVQGGQYQIAGANGPEFVDLDRDAIVFNHLQTASLLGKGHATTTGSPITSERRAVGAYATGNVSGLAFANGSIGSAIAAIDRAISIWQNIANITAADLAGGGGGGGGGDNSVKAVTEELTKWYNLTRQIEKLEQDINNLLAERENIIDGGEYLRSLREEQRLLAQQAATHQTLLAYQEEQLNRQKEHIKNNRIWSQFLTFDEFGNLQYIDGNETNGGQGQLNVLDQLNKMSGEEQLKYIKNTLGYSYTDQDGKTLDGEELITKFFEELQKQIDSYDSLYDTVHSTEEELQKIQTSISEINAEIEKNQMDLEKAIYDIILDSWKKQIEQMEDQKKLTQEANEAYIENLNKALSDERNMYSQNESIADRESLQNRLALLRRSGGSASEIYDLEQQLDDMLKDEYFNKQEEMIQNIEEASKEQIKKLEEQIKLEEEALEYQKENGVLWTQVYEIMRGTEESILAFMQGNSPEFFSQSALQQKQMLTDWAKQIGIYTEDQQYKNYQKEAEDTRWNNGSWRASASEGGVGQELAAVFDGLDADQQGTLQSLFTSTYANKMLETGNENAASVAAIAALQAQLRNIKSQQASAASSDGGDSDSNNQPPQQEKRYVYMRGTYNEDIPDGKGGFTFRKGDAARVGINTDSADKDFIRQKIRNAAHGRKVTITSDILYGFSEGGLVDYTGPAIVHGSPSKPEAFLNAKQTAMISEAIRAVGDGGALNGIKATLAALNSTIKSIVNNDNSLTSSFTVAPGAITIQVAQLSDSYDVEELSKDVMNRMVAIAARATNRGVNRR